MSKSVFVDLKKVYNYIKPNALITTYIFWPQCNILYKKEDIQF